MWFELTPEIIDQIIFAMENQESGFLFDSESCMVTRDRTVGRSNPERYLVIPEWTSADGFHLMEKFVASLRNPLAREKLRSALGSGKGVFRSFKDALKEHEGVERLWFSFKDREMKLKVTEWYNELCDAWGCARLPIEPDEEETEELVLSDFEVREGDGGLSSALARYDRQAYFEACAALPAALVEERYRADRAGIEPASSEMRYLVTYTPSGEFAGYIWGRERRLASSGGEGSGSLWLLEVIQLFVRPEYRGLGIAKQLVERVCTDAARRGVQRVLFSLPGKAELLRRYLEELGFEEFTRSLMIDLAGWDGNDLIDP